MCRAERTPTKKKILSRREHWSKNNNCRIKWSKYGTRMWTYIGMVNTHRLINVSLEEFIVTVLHAHILLWSWVQLNWTVWNKKTKWLGRKSDLIRNYGHCWWKELEIDFCRESTEFVNETVHCVCVNCEMF